MSGVWVDRITAVICILIGIYVTTVAWDFPTGGGEFPVFCGIATIFLALVMIAETFSKKYSRRNVRAVWPTTWSQWKPMVVLALAVTYIPMIFVIGYFTATLSFLVLTTLVLGIRNYKAIGLTAVILLPLMYFFFVGFLQAQLPRGILF